MAQRAAVESRGVQSLPPIKRSGKFAPSATAEASPTRMRVGSEMYWAVVAPGATMLRRMWLLGVLLLALGIGAPIALVVWIVVERDELVDLALDDRFLRAIAVTLAVALFARLVAVIEVAIVRRHDRNVGLSAIVAYVMVALLAVPVVWSIVRAEQAHDLVDDVFVGPDDAPPLYVPPGDTVAEEATAGTVSRRPDAEGDDEHPVARRRFRARSVGTTNRHDDPRLGRPGDGPHLAGVDPAQPASPAVPTGFAAR